MSELVSVPQPAGIDGISMLPALLNKPQRDHEYLYWEFHEGGFKQALRVGDWKAVRLAPGRPIELYDLARDIGEKVNIAGAHPEVVARMEKILATCRSESKDWPTG
jgi:arylsulfatase A-like enzyme